MPTETAERDAPPVGTETATSPASADIRHVEDDLVRVFSFSGGGFDTAMQLGCVHALLAIQGKPPNAIVGLSAGCVNAVALAEVMQAGDSLEQGVRWDELRDADARRERHQRRLEARVTRFFEILDRLARAPGDLFDGLLPDAYQVDARKPLQTVHSPIFVRRERESRDEAVANRTGLVNLYNYLLSVGLTFGTMTRIARRALGFAAAGDIRSNPGRWLVRILEVLRTWVLVGSCLGPLSRLVRPLVGAPLMAALRSLVPEWIRRRTRQAPGYTAGAIIFRFPVIERVVAAVLQSLLWLIVVNTWVMITLGLALLPWGASRLPLSLGLVGLQPFALPPWSVYVALLVGLVALLSVVRTVRDFDRTSLSRLALDIGKSFVFTAGLVALWGSVLYVVWVGWNFFRAPLAPGILPALRDAARAAWVDGLYSDDTWAVFAGIGLGFVVLVTFLIVRGRRGSRPGVAHPFMVGWMRRVLDSYRIKGSLFSSYAVERLCADLFDPTYWGSPPMSEVVEDALADRLDPWPGQRPTPARTPKTVASYSDDTRSEPIRVGLAAANLETGELELIDPSVSVVSALTAALSAVPFFKPKRLLGKYFVDGANITQEPMQGVFRLLEGALPDRIRAVHIYAVTPLPSRTGEALGPREERRPRLVATTVRAKRLRRLRDARLERRLTELYSQVLPDEELGVFHARTDGTNTSDPIDRRFVRSWVTPIESDRPIDLNLTLFRAERNEARQLLLESMADGCRAALQSMIRASLKDPPAEMSCAKAVELHMEARRKACSRKDNEVLTDLASVQLPGKCASGSGLAVVCDHCALRRDAENEADRGSRMLQFRTDEELGELPPPWPHERERGPVKHPRRLPTLPAKAVIEARAALAELPRDETHAHAWPPPIDGVKRDERPVRSLLFSGGVFRGVFQMGVVNALADVGLRPDLIAGASVGSITAGMTAAAFAAEGPDRARLLARLSAVYLALDRLVLTDRFADFIRNLTVRAAHADFSVQQADRVFRRFDSSSAQTYSRDTRRVLAGLERLFYMSPFEVLDLVKAVRHRDRPAIVEQLVSSAQEWLDRMDAGEEVLGADPLLRLIQEYVVPCVPRDGWRYPSGPSFDDLRTQHRIHFLATATNLVDERLEVLGMIPHAGYEADDGPGAPSLVQGLLASSAFPGVFRAREAHEVFPRSNSLDLYIDGGVIDNLPIDAVAEFLLAASTQPVATGSGTTPRVFEPLIARRPKTTRDGRVINLPHLVFSASLEVQARPYEGEALEALSWPELMSRTRQLGYNRKVDQYRRTQVHLRAIEEWIAARGDDEKQRQLVSLDLEVVVVKPRWLCKTFAFHPMLGFRRDRQAQSIAHGCASTLIELTNRYRAMPEAVASWQVDTARLPEHTSLSSALEHQSASKSRDHEAGGCWLRPGLTCPYSEVATRRLGLPRATVRELARIHAFCRRPETHAVEQK